MSRPAAFHVQHWAAADRLDEILAVVHAAFAGLQPPSGALNETLADVAKRQHDGTIFVARCGDELIGSLYTAAKDGALYLTRLAVVPQWQRRGVGRALVAAAQAQARQIRAPLLRLRVRVNLPGNLAYFQALGFAQRGQGQDPGRPPYYVMERAVLPMGSDTH